jgi:phage terminase Nu1 subunit (DNA packaging protein)
MEISKKDFADAMGVSKAMVTKYVRKGLPVTPHGAIDLASGREWVEKNIDRLPPAAHGSRKKDKTDRSGEDLTMARTRKESALASLHELELRLRENELAEVSDIAAVWESLVSAAQNRMLGLASKLARMLTTGDVQERQEIIEREIRSALSSLTEYQPNAAWIQS